MVDADETGLWRRSLGLECSQGDADRFRRRLIAALERFHERAALLAQEIARDLPEFTVHDASHSSALWGLADRIAGDEVTLTPTEAFVFGGACLIHDLGMASAAYVDGLESLQREPRWSDTVALILRQTLRRRPTRQEICEPDHDTRRAAREQVLRELHAEHAEALATATWIGADGTQYALLEDLSLRETYGPVIGQIAHSHWWATSTLGERFSHSLGPPAGSPGTWTVRPLILACLVRLSDASHLDASRAPRFLRSVRRPSAAARPHWEFQARLSQPYREGDRFVFTGSPFGIAQAEAWWQCADTLEMVDVQFREVDALLADRKETRFAIRGVAGASDLNRLAEYVKTTGWTPLDARVRVSNVVRLVERLGGRELYGPTPHIPLRELLQNASDAVRARRAIDGRSAEWGEISVRLGEVEADGRRRLEVEDTGVGMSRAVLTGHLLDFGASFWESERVLEELPGLLAAGFDSTGRFGIGFFSVFMWGDEVVVTSRRHDAGQAETYVLEFTRGVSGRPLLRVATPSERLLEPGTRVRILLDDETVWRLGLGDETPVVAKLALLCAWLAPALDVNLYAECHGQRVRALEANDWLRLPIEEVGNRLRSAPIRHGNLPGPVEESSDEAESDTQGTADEPYPEELVWVSPAVAAQARPLTGGDGRTVGRAVLNPREYAGGVVCVGGFRSTTSHSMTGILVGEATTASRQVGIPIVSTDTLSEWASEQATLLAPHLSDEEELAVAETVHMCGGDPGPLAIAVTGKGPLARGEVADWASELDKIIVVHDAALSNNVHAYGDVELNDNVAAIAFGGHSLLTDDPASLTRNVRLPWPREAGDMYTDPGLASVMREAVAEAWGISPESLDLWRDTSIGIGRRTGADVELGALVWHKTPA